jgi:hypothetical protein
VSDRVVDHADDLIGLIGAVVVIVITATTAIVTLGVVSAGSLAIIATAAVAIAGIIVVAVVGSHRPSSSTGLLPQTSVQLVEAWPTPVRHASIEPLEPGGGGGGVVGRGAALRWPRPQPRVDHLFVGY